VLGGISATGQGVWAVGYDKNGNGRDPLVEYHARNTRARSTR
jgi:hypothetical protein